LLTREEREKKTRRTSNRFRAASSGCTKLRTVVCGTWLVVGQEQRARAPHKSKSIEIQFALNGRPQTGAYWGKLFRAGSMG